MAELVNRIEQAIADVPDFPKKGIIFKDITPVLKDAALFADVVKAFGEHARSVDANVIAGVESRGFIFASALAMHLGLPCVLIRKPGKLPRETYQETYELEYGTDTLEVHRDDVSASDRVYIIDDLLATGGTAQAAANLIAKTPASVVSLAFMVELEFLSGREKLSGHDVYSLVKY